MRLQISRRAERAMHCELARYPSLETGGLLLGYADESAVRVLEATDGGPAAVLRTPFEFGMDEAYQQHAGTVLSQLYTPALQVVGLWHKHNNTCGGAAPFSQPDIALHRQLMQSAAGPCVSVLFQKLTDDAQACSYDLRAFVLEDSDGLTELQDIAVVSSPSFLAAE